MAAERTGYGDLLQSYLRRQIDDLGQQGPLVATGGPEAVHRVRVAARRLRSALATYRPLLQPHSTDHLRDELRWLGRLLAPARDAYVQRHQVEGLLREEPPELVSRAAVRVVTEELGSRYDAGRAAAAAGLAGKRFGRMMRALEALACDPPLAAGHAPVDRPQLWVLVERDWHRLRVRAEGAARSGPSDRDRALHGVRKAAKRLRYAAESTAPELGEPALRLAARAREVQDVLGEHQDTVVVRRTLLALAARVADPPAGFTLGRLHAREQQRATELERRYAELASGLVSTPPWETSGRWSQTSSGSR